MLDIGWSEMAMIALLALIVIGPKDLPRVMRTVGQWVRKARGIARDFQSSLDEMIQDDELKEARRQIEAQTRHFQERESFGIGKELERHVDSSGTIRQTSEDLDKAVKDDPTGPDNSRDAAPKATYSAAETPVAPGNSLAAGKPGGGGEGESPDEGKAGAAEKSGERREPEPAVEYVPQPPRPRSNSNSGES